MTHNQQQAKNAMLLETYQVSDNFYYLNSFENKKIKKQCNKQLLIILCLVVGSEKKLSTLIVLIVR
jgi:hypothetical protein